MTDGIKPLGKDGFVATGSGVFVVQAVIIKSALKACKIGLRVNRAYTPTACLRTAGNITGRTFKRGQYDEAIAALETWIAEQKKETPE